MIRNIYHKAIMIMALCTLSFASCQVEDFDEIKNVNPQKAFTLNAKAEGMSIHKVTSRGSDAKTQAESEIKDLHFFIFSSSNTLLQHTHLTGGTTSLMVESTETNATVYAIANVESGKITGSESMAALDAIVYTPSNYTNWLEIPETGMPMVGKATGVNLNVAKGTYNVPMKALMARVDMNISINSTYADADKGYPQMTLTNIEMNNIPTGAPFTAGTTTNIASVGKTSVSKEVNEGTIYNGNGEFAFTFYVFENIQTPTNTNPTYPTGIKDDEKQAYKPLLANEDAINFKFTGEYTDHNGSKYLATYTLYLGKNHTNDFTIVRNHQYKNNIAITGLNKTNLPGGSNPATNTDIYSFDARVNIELSNNFYVNLLRERDFDAHCCVAPMDIYIQDGNNVTVSVDENQTWLRIEKVESENMAASGYAAMTGVQPYFTTNLLTDIVTATSVECTNRDRVYIYIDENLSTKDRETTIIFNNGTITKNITIRQVGLKKVHIVRGNFQRDIYIETYEEYLNHYDPLNEYSTKYIYAGLPWGASGTSIGGGYSTNQDNDAYIYTQGNLLTPIIIGKTGKSDQKWTTVPLTAAEYCYNKNKRNSDGSVNTTKGTWYLPGISELEGILATYYTTYTEFQDYFYWSVAPAKKAGFLGFESESNTEARATKAYINSSGGFSYVESGSKDSHLYSNGGGRAPRTTVLRIRAAYVPASGQTIE